MYVPIGPMRKIYAVILFFIQVTFVQAQMSVLPLDEDTDFPSEQVYSDGNLLFSLYAQPNPGFTSATLKIRQWNGQFWVKYPDFVSNRIYFNKNLGMGITKHKDSLFIAASFISNDTFSSGILKFNGKQWVGIGGLRSTHIIHPEFTVNDMLSFDNKLFVCGDFNIAGNKLCKRLVYYQNGNWEAIDNQGSYINDFLAINDSMYVAGNFTSIAGVTNFGLAVYSKGNWHSTSSPAPNLLGLGEFQKELIAVSESNIYIRKNAVWTSISNNYKCLQLGSIQEHDGMMYVSGQFENKNGNRIHLLRWDGNKWEELIDKGNIWPNRDLNYKLSKTDKEFIFSGRISSLFNQKTSNFVVLHPNQTILSGRLFKDKNEDCVFNTGDEPISNAILSINNGQYYHSTNQDGIYRIALKSNSTYSLEVFDIDDYISHCKTKTIQINTLSGDQVMEENFPYKKNAEPFENHFIVSSNGFKVKHGFWGNYNIQYKDINQNYPVIVSLLHDPRLIEFQSKLNPEQIFKGEKRWWIHSDTIIHFDFRINPNEIAMGEILEFSTQVLSTSNFEAINSEKTLSQLVVSAYDPNDKQCNELEIPSNQKELKYHIRFQNMGTETATDVHVVDTISQTLPMEFIKILSTSHIDQYSVNFKVRDHAIVWTFKGIELETLNSAGEIKSSGFIQFKAGLEKGLIKGDSIKNQAFIYFDFQPPVATNTIVTRVIENSLPVPVNASNFLSIYPNPNNGEFNIHIQASSIQKIELFDACGKIIDFKTIEIQNNTASLQMSKFASGIYTVRVVYPTGVVSGKLIVN
jgi:uncharacterized repeat protein (TIGR01451 family)